MNYQVTNMADIHFEHKTWGMELSFWEDELKIFNNRLGELANRWTVQEVLSILEHFQNQFIIHGNVIDDMQHEINVHETKMSQKDKGNLPNGSGISEGLHIKFREKIEVQRSIYGTLKKDFFKFLTKYM